MESQGSAKPTIRILHQLARCGGTVIAKCLGAMKNVVLLSEIHPDQVNNMDAVRQAYHWFNVFLPEDEPFFIDHELGNVSFVEGFKKIQQRCEEQNKILIIRDWNHIDFLGRPRNRELPYKLSCAELLKDHFNLKQFCIVRHPLDQWLSFRKSQNKLGIVRHDLFLKGYVKFVDIIKDLGYIKYEDFTKNPEELLQVICKKLDMPYDPEFINKWGDYDLITGDVYGDGRGRNKEIEVFKRLQVEQEVLKQISDNPDYQRSVEILGYDAPEPDPFLTDPVKLKRDRNKSDLLAQHGENLYLNGNKGVAMEAFHAALSICPTNPIALNNIGVHMYQTEENKIEAMKYLFRATELGADDKDIIINCAKLYASYFRPDLACHLLLDYIDTHEPDDKISKLFEKYQYRKIGQSY